MTRTIAVVTGGRADFGHLTGLAHAIEADRDLELQLVVTGSHLSQRHGATVSEVAAEGFVPAAQSISNSRTTRARLLPSPWPGA